MNPFIPEFEGDLEVARVPDDFVVRLRKRVEEGLFRPGKRARANYSVRSAGPDEISFGADDFLTACSVGLNEVTVRRAGATFVHYRATFWRWTWTAVAHGAVIGAILLVFAVTLRTMRRQIAAYSYGPILFGSLVVFFGILWPWILAAIHRRFAEKSLRRILGEVLT